MEGIKKTSENVEELSQWKMLKKEALENADGLIAEIEGYDAMEPSEKIATLQEILTTLGDDNRNRYLHGEIFRRIEVVKENERHETKMRSLLEVA